MRRISIVATVALFASVLSMSFAVATPPTGQVEFKDLARAQTVESASVPIHPGTALTSGSYSIAPGGETGWRQLPGAAILAVTKGKMTVHRADGCAAKDYALGQAAVLTAGTVMVGNSGNEPLEFFGVFFDQAQDGPKPLAEGPTAAMPASCTAAAAASPSGVSLATPEIGTMAEGMFGNGATLDIQAGKDVYASYLDISPGWSSGWISHRPAVNIVSGGELSYVMAHDGKCDTSEKYHTGQAFYHPAHRHMAYNEGKDHVLLTTMYFDLPHETPAPVIGNTITAVDFTQAPPADCPRLR
jgi:quercetin dioxygenase-like cupin family protein